jgi:hypothetical protein
MRGQGDFSEHRVPQAEHDIAIERIERVGAIQRYDADAVVYARLYNRPVISAGLTLLNPGP